MSSENRTILQFKADTPQVEEGSMNLASNTPATLVEPEVIEVLSDDEVEEIRRPGERGRRHSVQHQTISDEEFDEDYVEPDVVEVDDESLFVENDDDDVASYPATATTTTTTTTATATAAAGDEDEDIVVLNTTSVPRVPSNLNPNRRRRVESDILRNIRRRTTHPGSNEGVGGEDDVEIIHEGPAATRLRNPLSRDILLEHITRGDVESYRRQLIDRLQNGVLETPFGSFSSGDQDIIYEELTRLEFNDRGRQIQEHIGGLLNNMGHRTRNSPLRFLRGIFGGPNADGSRSSSPGSENEIEASILARIERDNENRLDHRLQSENVYNKKVLNDKKNIAANELKGYTNNISEENNIGCELCGINLGEGIPQDFKPNPKYDTELASYQEQYRVISPWFCFKQCTEVDKELSKRVFAAKCGHLYCGRCFKNIGSRVPLRRKKNDIATIENPRLFSPRNCVATECGNSFRGKAPFSEVFF